MIAGIDPFNAEDPMTIYNNILEHKFKFPSYFNRFSIINLEMLKVLLIIYYSKMLQKDMVI